MAVETTPLGDSSTRRADMANVRGCGHQFAELIRRDPLSTTVTIFIDVLSATVAVLIAWWWNSASGQAEPPIWMAAAFVPTVILLLLARQVYRRKLNRRFIDEVAPIVAVVALASMLLLTARTFVAIPERSESIVAKVWICATAMMLTARLIRTCVQRTLRRHNHLVSPTLIVGNGVIAHQIIDRLAATPEYGLVPIGLLDVDAAWDPLAMGPWRLFRMSVRRSPSKTRSSAPTPRRSSSPSHALRTNCSPARSAPPIAPAHASG